MSSFSPPSAASAASAAVLLSAFLSGALLHSVPTTLNSVPTTLNDAAPLLAGAGRPSLNRRFIIFCSALSTALFVYAALFARWGARGQALYALAALASVAILPLASRREAVGAEGVHMSRVKGALAMIAAVLGMWAILTWW
ncbi:hypothetical protein K488DRAFT_87549 [Vararia minispora EC-137]|uniref:Uncharacterized protein n=1 Tax=Vararia minispora EC-137 TaxID=1314806 RepID=A0ACB8QG95_9AGAM|nr:hypothetical protein K488DRAFT_87549 [Vararia minispora EC-137]